MDLILAHKRSMKLAELAGLSLSAQTTFATAVSEVSRSAIENSKTGCLILSAETDSGDKYIVACLKEEQTNKGKGVEGLEFAKRLVNKYNVSRHGKETTIELYYAVPSHIRVDLEKLDEWRRIFRNEPAVSPYEEIKLKNEQLQQMSERLRKSEVQYQTLTNTLPQLIFSLDPEGHLLYANEWLLKFTGKRAEDLDQGGWEAIIHADDYHAFSLLWDQRLTKSAASIKMQLRLKPAAGDDYLWHQVSLSPFHNENQELQSWIGYMVDIHSQKVYEETLRDNIELKETQEQLRENQRALENYIRELNRSNLELQQFAFVASHDLQEPVRKMLFYSDYLMSQYQELLQGKGLEYLTHMQSSGQRMRDLIQDLLVFSQINKEKTHFSKLDLNKVMQDAVQDLEMAIEEKKASLRIESLPTINGDEGMLRQLFENLISNSLKYARPNTLPEIHISCQVKDGHAELAFADNGIGFDEKYLPKMFTLFQRLHSREQYEGTGLGLAICRKIADVHQGRIWAQSKADEGATFFVSLPVDASVN